MLHATTGLFTLLTTGVLAAQASWTQLYPANSPSPRSGALMGYHAASDTLLLMFGSGMNDAWQLSGNDWVPYTGVLPPDPGGAGVVYDSARQRLLLFGGGSHPNLSQELWEWDGTTWLNPLLATKPPGRSSHGMAYDPVRGVTVVYGGNTGTVASYREDLWEWDGSTWTLVAATNPPGARYDIKMAFDPNTGTVLLHGGCGVAPGGSSTVPLNDTWSWDGTSWQLLQPATPPHLRFGGRMVCDTARERVVLWGGTNAAPFVWEWDGQDWEMIVQSSPSERSAHAMAYDSTLRRVVMFGGRWLGGSSFPLGDTWLYQTPSPAETTTFGVGCAGTAGVPALANDGLPWLGDTVVNTVSSLAPSSAGAVFVSSFGQTTPVDLTGFGMPGCDLLVPADVVEFEAATAGGIDWQLTIPNAAALAGVSFRQQAFPLDAAANQLGLSASNGLTLTVGIR